MWALSFLSSTVMKALSSLSSENQPVGEVGDRGYSILNEAASNLELGGYRFV